MKTRYRITGENLMAILFFLLTICYLVFALKFQEVFWWVASGIFFIVTCYMIYLDERNNGDDEASI